MRLAKDLLIEYTFTDTIKKACDYLLYIIPNSAPALPSTLLQDLDKKNLIVCDLSTKYSDELGQKKIRTFTSIDSAIDYLNNC